MTTPTPDPIGGERPATFDDAPTSPLDLPPLPASAPPTPGGPVDTVPTPAGPPPASPPPGQWGGVSSVPPGTVPPPAGAAPSPRPGAQPNTQPALVVGIILVIIGAVLLVTRLVDVTLGPDAWPLWIIVPGVAMLVASFFIPPRGGLGLAIPGAIVATVGIVLWVQDAYDAYATWAYAWALVAPTAPGLGTMLYGLARSDRELVRDGLRTTLVGLALFGGFALFFEGVIGLSGEPIPNLEAVLPYAVIGLGILLVVLSLFGGGRRKGPRSA